VFRSFLPSLCAFASLHLREASSKEDWVESFFFLLFIFVFSVSARSLLEGGRWFNFCLFSATLPCSRRSQKWQIGKTGESEK
jgi:hypothetical protein